MLSVVAPGNNRAETGASSTSRSQTHRWRCCRSTSLRTPDPGDSEDVEMASIQANALLNQWRDIMSSFFPFVIIPPLTTAEDIQRERPFLLKSILAVASRNPKQQILLGISLVRELASRVAVNGERNLDLLLGVLTYTGWYASLSLPSYLSIHNVRSDNTLQVLLQLSYPSMDLFA